MRWLASDTWVPEPKFCRYAVYAATVPVFSASAQAFSSASLGACSSDALLLRRLLRIRGLAASGNEGSARDGSDKCPFRKRDASGGFRLSRRFTVHGCSSLVAAAHPAPL